MRRFQSTLSLHAVLRAASAGRRRRRTLTMSNIVDLVEATAAWFRCARGVTERFIKSGAGGLSPSIIPTSTPLPSTLG